MDVIKYLRDQFVKHEKDIFLVDNLTGIEYSYGQIFQKGCSVGNLLNSMEIKKGDRIAILLENSIEFVSLYFGCLLTGVVAVPINPTLGEDITHSIIKSCRAKMLLTKNASICNYKKSPNIKTITISNDESEKADICPEKLNAPADFVPFNNMSDTDDILLIYTSGTTAEPKGIIHRLDSIVKNGLVFIDNLKVDPTHRFINYLPMAYLGGYYNLLLIPFLAGASVVLSNAFNASNIITFWKPIIKNKVNTIWFVPSIMSMLLEIDRGNEGHEYCRKSVIKCFVGTAPLHDSLLRDFESKYGIKLYENFALSETLFITTNSPGNASRIGVGKLLPDVSLRICDRHMNPVPEGSEGEIAVKTFSLMKGYLDPASDTTSVDLHDGYFFTGDLGKFLPDGNLLITGRKKDLIIKGGINISPAFVEEVILNNSHVSECAIIGLPHKIMGEEIACVIRKSSDINFETLKEELKKIVEEKLPLIYRPTKYFELPVFPRTPSGKVQKAKIKAWIINEVQEDDSLKTSRTPNYKGKHSFFQPSKVVHNSIQATSIRYNNVVYEMKSKGIDVTVLSLGEAFFDIPLFPFNDLPYPDLYHYSHSRGIPELRKQLSNYYEEKYEVSVNPESEMIITAGSKIAIHMSLMSVLNPGDEVIILEPAWVSYPEQVKLCYANPVMVPYDKTVFEIEEFITNRTKVIIINNPNNPSGKVYSIKELTHLVSLAEKYSLFIISDEAYSDFLLEEEKFTSIGSIDTNKTYSIICNSMSKNYGMSGWRVGYVISYSEIINQILKVNQHLITCPSTILEYYLSKHFNEIINITKPQIIEVVNKRQKIAIKMKEIGLEALPGTATFYFFVSIKNSKLSSEEFCWNLLKEKNICVVPGIGYGNSCDKFVRMSIGAESMERINNAMIEIKKYIDKTS